MMDVSDVVTDRLKCRDFSNARETTARAKIIAGWRARLDGSVWLEPGANADATV
jgi:hypothetical protein